MAVALVVIALIAAFFGFGVAACYFSEGGKIVFLIFLILAALAFLGHVFRRRSFWQ